MIEVITERVMVTTRTAAQDTKPLLLKLRNPAFIILLKAVIAIAFSISHFLFLAVVLGIPDNLAFLHGDDSFAYGFDDSAVVRGQYDRGAEVVDPL